MIHSFYQSWLATVAQISAGLAIAVAAYFLSPPLLRKIIVKDGNTLPPGPNVRYAFLGKYPELSVDVWAKQYGPLFSIWMGNQLFVVVSDPRVARDLFVLKGGVISSRKKYFMKNKMILHGRAITASEYGDKWRQHRRIAAQVLTRQAVVGFGPTLEYETDVLLRSLYEATQGGKTPVDPAHHVGRFTLNNMLTISCATRTDSSLAPLVKRALDLAAEFNDLTGPWSNAIDFLTPLQWLPSRMKTRGRELHNGLIEVYGGMISDVKARMDAGEEVPDCLVKTLLMTQEEEKLDWEDLCMLSAVFTLGGFASTAGIIDWFLAFIPSFPEVQKRAHEELDRIVGRDRLPTMEDERDLPYIRAIIKELQRVHAPFWMGTPHCATEDVTYNGFHIPKGTAVVLNCYTLHHNEERYPDPFTFNPDRYLGDGLTCAQSAALPDAMERDHWTFGAGRRICPGLHLVHDSLWLAISRLLWSFTFHELPDEPISLEEYEGTSGRTPVPFRIGIVPRFEGLEKSLRGGEIIGS